MTGKFKFEYTVVKRLARLGKFRWLKRWSSPNLRRSTAPDDFLFDRRSQRYKNREYVHPESPGNQGR